MIGKISNLRCGIINYLHDSLKKLYTSASRAQSIDPFKLTSNTILDLYKKIQRKDSHCMTSITSANTNYYKIFDTLICILKSYYNFHNDDKASGKSYIACDKITMKLFSVVNMNDYVTLLHLTDQEIHIPRLVDYLDSIVRSIYLSYIPNFVTSNLNGINDDSIRLYKLYNNTKDFEYVDSCLRGYAYHPAYSLNLDIGIDQISSNKDTLTNIPLTTVVLYPLNKRAALYYTISPKMISITSSDMLKKSDSLVTEIYSFTYENGEDCYNQLIKVYRKIFEIFCDTSNIDNNKDSNYKNLYKLVNKWPHFKQIMKFQDTSFIKDLFLKIHTSNQLVSSSSNMHRDIYSINIAFFNLIDKLAIAFKDHDTSNLKCIYFVDSLHQPKFIYGPHQFRSILVNQIANSNQTEEVIKMSTISQNQKQLSKDIKSAKEAFFRRLRDDQNSIVTKAFDAISNMYIKDVGINVFRSFGCYKLSIEEAMMVIPKLMVTLLSMHKENIQLALWFVSTYQFDKIRALICEADFKDYISIPYNKSGDMNNHRLYILNYAYNVKISNDIDSIGSSIISKSKYFGDLAHVFAMTICDYMRPNYIHKVNNPIYSISMVFETYIRKFKAYLLRNKRLILPYLSEQYSTINHMMSIDPNIQQLYDMHRNNKNEISRRCNSIIKCGVLEPMNNIKISDSETLESFISQCNYYASCDYTLYNIK